MTARLLWHSSRGRAAERFSIPPVDYGWEELLIVGLISPAELRRVQRSKRPLERLGLVANTVGLR